MLGAWAITSVGGRAAGLGPPDFNLLNKCRGPEPLWRGPGPDFNSRINAWGASDIEPGSPSPSELYNMSGNLPWMIILLALNPVFIGVFLEI